MLDRFVRRSWCRSGAALALAVVGLTVGRSGLARAGDPPATPAQAPAASPSGAPAAAKRRFPTDKEQAELLPFLKAYLDGDSPDGFKHRIGLSAQVKRLADAGADLFTDIDKLRTLIYSARPFLFNYEKKSIPKELSKDADVRFDSGSGVTSVKWGDYRFGISLPPAYLAARDQKKLNSVKPFPMIVVLHSKEDYEDAKSSKPYPGEEAIKRLYPKTSMKAVTDGWIVYSPVYPKGKFVEDDGVQKARVPVKEVFRHFHVDFDRIVIEGGPEALLFAAAYPSYYAGVIVHGETTQLPAELAHNLDSTWVYVVQTSDKLAPCFKTLTDARSEGDDDAVKQERLSRLASGPPTAVVHWLPKVKRTLPKSFSWVVKDKSAHRFAHWINIDVLSETAPLPTIEAEIVDTADNPNTVQLRTTGILGITIFLNDQLIDLDREVRVVINGKPLDECRIESNEPGGNGTAVRLPAKFEKTVDGMFDRRTISVRKSQMYGFMFPVVLEQVEIRSDAPPKDVPDPNAAGLTREQQRNKAAENYLKKAEDAESTGDFAKAKKLYQKCIDEGDTDFKDKAETKLAALEAKCAKPAEPDKPAEPGMGEAPRVHK